MSVIDPTTLAQLFDAAAPGLVLYARQWLDTQEAQDVVQEAFIKLMQQRPQPDDAKAWLCRIVRNQAIDRLRSAKRRQQRELTVSQERAPWFDPRPDDLVDAASAQAALATLPEEQRDVVVLRIWNGLTLAQIATVIGCPVSTVFSRYQSALTAIRRRLEEPCKTSKD
jgi:RNA polymerase sigma factor (sigma-70 family)